MKKVVVLVTLLAFVLTGSVVLAAGAKDLVCCKAGKVVKAKNAAACTKAGGKMVPKAQCKVPAKAK
jgi:hypothetical protein